MNWKTSIPKSAAICAAALGTLSFAVPAHAGTSPPASVAVTLIIDNSCTFNGSGTLDFGTRITGTATSNIDAASTGLTVTCAGAAPTATINVSGGNNLSGTQRRLRLGTTTTYVPYDLYQDAGRTTKFDPTIFQSIPGGLAAGTSTLTLYGRIPLGSTLPNGNGISFTDAVQVTVTY